jgi:hypothetical protein
MPPFDTKKVLAKLDALRTRDKKRSVFGSSGHLWKLDPKLTEADVAAVEKQCRVKLPDDYRTFLLEIGAGGAGPAYGIFPLVRERGKWCWDGDGGHLTGDLAKPFPHAKKWNASFEPWDEEAEAEDDYWERRREWDEELYWHPKQTTGAICICHEGCAIRDWLVVTGPQRGMIWLDDRASDGGLIPQKKTFAEWYLAWLAKAARSFRTSV